MRSVIEVTIEAGESLSTAADLGMEGNLSGVILPAGWTTADFQLEGSMDNTNFFPMFTAIGDVVGTDTTGAAAASTFYVLDKTYTIPARYVKVRSGTSAVPVAQVSEVVLQLIAGKFSC